MPELRDLVNGVFGALGKLLQVGNVTLPRKRFEFHLLAGSVTLWWDVDTSGVAIPVSQRFAIPPISPDVTVINMTSGGFLNLVRGHLSAREIEAALATGWIEIRGNQKAGRQLLEWLSQAQLLPLG
ncbi:MAG: hypothetical protein WC480_00980 [Patescibacteria group bacterium]